MDAKGEIVRQNDRIAKELFGLLCDYVTSEGCKNYKILQNQVY